MDKNKFDILEGKTLVYKRDPLFGNCGWVIEMGFPSGEMQTMDWVSEIMKGQKCRGLGDKVQIIDGQVTRDN